MRTPAADGDVPPIKVILRYLGQLPRFAGTALAHDARIADTRMVTDRRSGKFDGVAVHGPA